MCKYFLDNIHGNIKICSNLLQIIHLKEFQRLKKIKQLGNAHYVFMSATHTRFEHSIGVAHLCGKLLTNIKENQPMLNISDRDILLVKIAGLFHDIGHGCFSHLFDSHFLKVKLNNTPLSNYIHHEYRSVKIIRHVMKKYNLPYTEEEIDFICNLITHEKDYSRPAFMYEIVSNIKSGLDCDKIDYLIRDTKSVGIESSINYKKMFIGARVIDNTICYPYEDALDIFQLFHLRYIMHKKVYQHQTIREIDYMIADVLRDIDTRLHIADNIADIDEFCKCIDCITDIDIFITPDTIVNKLMTRITKRNLYKCIYYGINNKVVITEKYKLMLQDEKIKENIMNIALDNSTINYNMKHKNPMNEIYFYMPDNVNKKVKLNENTIIYPSTFQETITMIIVKNNIEFLGPYIKEKYGLF
jgi:HD superfamily phosphohydrolase